MSKNMSECRIVKRNKGITVKIERCKDVVCCRDDHLFCPGKTCGEILHPLIVNDDNDNNATYEAQMTYCMNVICYDSCHIMCPECRRTFHMNLTIVV